MISICIPTFNRCNYLQSALKSCLSQADAPIHEIIISDNASTDKTEEYVQEFIKKSPVQVKYIRHEKNIGAARNFASAIRLSHGRYINILCSDDLLVKRSLAKKLHIAKLNNYDSSCRIIGSDTILVDSRLKILGCNLSPSGITSGQDMVAMSCIARVNFFGNPGNLLINGDAARANVDLLDGKLKYLGDFRYYAGILCDNGGHYYNCDDYGLCYRIHDGMDTKQGCADLEMRNQEWSEVGLQNKIALPYLQSKFFYKKYYGLQAKKAWRVLRYRRPVGLAKI